MNHRFMRAGLLAALLTTLACQSEEPPPAPGPGVLQPAGLLYQGPLWTRPAGSSNGTTACSIRPSLSGCQDFIETSVQAVAVAGQRLAVVMVQERHEGPRGWELLISEDLGTTVRRFPLTGAPWLGGRVGLHLQAGRVFVLASAPSMHPARAGARLLEVDPVRGTMTDRGAMSSTTAFASADGTLASVDFARAMPPQTLAMTRFDPRTDTIAREDLPCGVAGCEPSSLAYPFLSSDGDSFDFLSESATPDGPSCLLTVKRGSGVITSECLPRLPPRNVSRLSSLGGTPFDFQLARADGGADAFLEPVQRHWLPSGPPVRFAADRLHALGEHLLVFSPSGFTDVDDDRLLRLRAGGQLEEAALQHKGCLNLSPYVTPDNCPRAISLHALSGDQLLLITRRDEFAEEGRSRELFETTLLSPSYTAFRGN